jgi:hypothetical protein
MLLTFEKEKTNKSFMLFNRFLWKKWYDLTNWVKELSVSHVVKTYKGN